MQTLNVAQSAFASAVFPDIFFKDYSVSGKIDNCKILLKVGSSRPGIALSCLSAHTPLCGGTRAFPPGQSVCAFAPQSMSAVFKFPGNVEEFSINLDCDKSELLVTLDCKDGTRVVHFESHASLRGFRPKPPAQTPPRSPPLFPNRAGQL